PGTAPCRTECDRNARPVRATQEDTPVRGAAACNPADRRAVPSARRSPHTWWRPLGQPLSNRSGATDRRSLVPCTLPHTREKGGNGCPLFAAPAVGGASRLCLRIGPPDKAIIAPDRGFKFRLIPPAEAFGVCLDRPRS